MIQVSNSADGNTTREAAWDLLSDFEGVWEDSNPAHRGTKVLSEPKRPLRDGPQWCHLKQEERILGLLTVTNFS